MTWICPHPAGTLLLAGAMAGATLARPADPTTVEPATVTLDQAVDRFDKSYRGKRKADAAVDALMIRLHEEIVELGPGETEADAWRFVREQSVRLAQPADGERSRYKRKTVKNEADRDRKPDDILMPVEIRYRFGHRDLAAVDASSKELVRELKKNRGVDLAQVSAAHRYRLLLNGCLPETELALAAVQRELDIDQTGDDYARFLEAWRNRGPNGDESFYEALDRTAGTDDAIFFYDAMLADFVSRFIGKPGRQWSLAERHDRLHQAFLSYRQYRSLIEAMSYALVLPSTVSFPARLARYDYGSVSAGAYSLRHVIDIMAAVDGYDGTLELCQRFLADHPLPDPLWTAYQPVGPFMARFQSSLGRYMVGGKSTDQIANDQRATTARLATRLQEATFASALP